MASKKEWEIVGFDIKPVCPNCGHDQFLQLLGENPVYTCPKCGAKIRKSE